VNQVCGEEGDGVAVLEGGMSGGFLRGLKVFRGACSTLPTPPPPEEGRHRAGLFLCGCGGIFEGMGWGLWDEVKGFGGE